MTATEKARGKSQIAKPLGPDRPKPNYRHDSGRAQAVDRHTERLERAKVRDT